MNGGAQLPDATNAVAGAELAGLGYPSDLRAGGQRCPGGCDTGASPQQHLVAVEAARCGSAPATIRKPQPLAALGHPEINTLVVGLGSAHGDDQIGWRVVEGLAVSSVVVRIARSPTELLGWLDGLTRLIVCDACQNLGVPGDILRLRWPDSRLALLKSSGSHDMGLAEVLALADQLGRLPKEVVIWCAQVETTLPGSSLSASGCAAVSSLVDEIIQELGV